MPRVSVIVNHSLSTEKAKSRIREGLSALLSKSRSDLSNCQSEWEEDAVTATYSTPAGRLKMRLAFEPAQVEMNAELPFALGLMRGKIEREARMRLEEILA